ncbi:MAG: MFS transporter [Nitrospirae bacterium]|nr:MFS transporter [Nitrospirota bacterium]
MIFPVYYANFIVGNDGGLGDLWWGRVVSLSMAVVAISSPFLGGIADYKGSRKRFLFFYTTISVTAIGCLSFLKQGMVIEGFILATLANIGMEGGIVFYNSFLPRIVPREYQGRVSGWGFGVGYAGSIISLLIAVPLVRDNLFGATWLMVSIFFALCSAPAFLFLPRDTGSEISITEAGIKGFKFTMRTLKDILKRSEVKKFLIAYLIYEDGVNTVIVFSSVYAATTLGFMPDELIILYIVVQISALLGAFIMARPIDYMGPKRVVILSLLMWILVAIIAFFVNTKMQYQLLASFAGLGLGTIQAATRAMFTQFIPEKGEAEYFGIYSLVGKSSAIMGPLLFGWLSSALRSQRPAILSIVIFFLTGLLIIRTVKGGGPNI